MQYDAERDRMRRFAAVDKLRPHGFRPLGGHIFYDDKTGRKHDLSAADLDQIDLIRARGLFVVDEPPHAGLWRYPCQCVGIPLGPVVPRDNQHSQWILVLESCTYGDHVCQLNTMLWEPQRNAPESLGDEDAKDLIDKVALLILKGHKTNELASTLKWIGENI